MSNLVQFKLITEQHSLCAYCMAHIEKTNVYGKKTVKIEHYKPINKKNNPNCKSDTFNYYNYFIVCMGGTDIKTNKKRVLCCDSAKSEKKITIDPTNKAQIKNVFYHSNGIIDYADKTNRNEEITIKDDINNTLNLNGKWDKRNQISICDTSTDLKQRRRNAYEAAEEDVMNQYKAGSCTEEFLKNRINTIKTEHWEFEGVYLYVYSKYLNKGRMEKSKQSSTTAAIVT